MTFDCGGDKTKYSCKTDVDFNCTGIEYNCTGEFECNSGHLYSCLQGDNCSGDFTCSSGTNCKGTVINSCTPSSQVQVYNISGGGTTPGDFLCGGWSPNGTESFDCNDSFKCQSKSDFACVPSANFDCGQTGGSSSFVCQPQGTSSTEGFVCHSTFNCPSSVDCSSAAGAQTYACAKGATYNNGGQG